MLLLEIKNVCSEWEENFYILTQRHEIRQENINKKFQIGFSSNTNKPKTLSLKDIMLKKRKYLKVYNL